MIDEEYLLLDNGSIHNLELYFYELRKSKGFVSALILDDISEDNMKMFFIQVNNEKFVFPLFFKHIKADMLRDIPIGIEPMKNFLRDRKNDIQNVMVEDPTNTVYPTMIEIIDAAIYYIEEYRTFALQIKHCDVMIAESLNINEANIIHYVDAIM